MMGTYILYYLAAINVITFVVYGIDKLKAKKGEMAHTGSHLAPTGHRWRKYRCLDGYESMASQNDAQEVQIWHSFDFDDTNRAISLLDNPIESPFQFLYHQPKTQPATLQLSRFCIFAFSSYPNYLSERFRISRVMSI